MNVGDIIADGEYTAVKVTIKGGAAHRVAAPPEALAAVNHYLLMGGHTKGPMFRRVKGGDGRLSRIAIYNVIKKAVKRSVINGDFLRTLPVQCLQLNNLRWCIARACAISAWSRKYRHYAIVRSAQNTASGFAYASGSIWMIGCWASKLLGE